MRSEIFHGEVDIEYILTLSTNHSDHLVLSFPGLFGGMPGSVGYLQTINKLGCNALFIKCDYRKTDFAKSRLTCINRDFVIERSIMALVDKIKQDVGAVNVIATGSSMGGWCALYYGLKYDCDIICGSPESFEEPMSVKYMAGGTTPEDKAWAGGLLSETIKNAGKRNYSKKISISFGKGEPAWTNKRLGKRLLDELESEGLNYENTLLNYSDHNSVAKLFPYFLENRLMVYLGMAETSELDIRNDAMKLSDALNDEFRGLLPLLDTLESTDMNIDIVGQKSYMGNDIMTYMRNFLYATRGYFWYPGYIQPVKTPGPHHYWGNLKAADISEASTFDFVWGVLKYYEYSMDKGALEWCGDILQSYIENVSGIITSVKAGSDWWNTISRFYFILNYLRLARGIEGVYCDRAAIKFEIKKCMRQIFSSAPYINDAAKIYGKLLMLLHCAKLFSDNEKFRDSAYNTALKLLNTLNDYCFDGNGVCIVRQSFWQYKLRCCLVDVLNFIDSNGFPENFRLKSVRRQFDKVNYVMSLLISPSGEMPAYGQSYYWTIPADPGLERKKDIFIKPESNFAVISTENAYVAIGSGTGIHAIYKHCDLLAFQFCYDKTWLILDGGGGDADAVLDYSISSTAHSALLCDDKDYIQPDYSDWTAMNDCGTGEGWAVIYMSHRLFDGVVLKRIFIWLEPNVIILLDEAASEAEHKFTQNFILPNKKFFGDSTVSIKIDSVTLQIKQFAGEYILKEYHGTTNKNDTLENMRGSIISCFGNIGNGLNLAYEKTGSNAVFLTAIEAHSDNAEINKTELTVRAVRADESLAEKKLVVTLSDDSEKVIPLQRLREQ